jgi:hypothetical protein
MQSLIVKTPMTKRTDDFTEKPKHQTREAALDFVVPLPLLECITRLEQADKTLPTRFYIYYDDAKRNTLKQVNFVIMVKNPELRTRVNGTIKQKDANLTQFIGTAEFVHELDKSINTRLNISSLGLLFIILASVYLVFTQPSVFVPFMFFVALLIYLVLILVLDSRNTAIKMQQLTEAIQRQLLFE